MSDMSALSIPKFRKVCGHEIKKMPIGAYLRALDRLSQAPEEFFTTCFPGQKPEEIIDTLTKLDKKGFTSLVAGLFAIAPRYIIGLTAELTGIDSDVLINDENIGLDGFMDILTAFVEVNSLGELHFAVSALKEKLGFIKKLTPNGGFND